MAMMHIKLKRCKNIANAEELYIEICMNYLKNQNLSLRKGRGSGKSCRRGKNQTTLYKNLKQK